MVLLNEGNSERSCCTCINLYTSGIYNNNNNDDNDNNNNIKCDNGFAKRR